MNQSHYARYALLLSSLWLPARALRAQDTASSEHAPAEPEVEMVVTGARVEEPVDRATSATEVIGRREIVASGARDAAELLETRPGMQIVRSFRGSELQLRGLDPQYTLILVDGDRVPGQIDGAIDLTRYGVENIERIEIVRGPGSALYGSDAIGGIINLITRESKKPFETSGQASYGLHHTLDLSGLVAGRPVAPLRLQLTADLHRADAFHRAGQVNTALSAREQWSSGGRVFFEADPRNTLIVLGEYLHTDLNGVDRGAGNALFDRTQLQEQARATFEHRLQASKAFKLVSRASYSQFREQYLLDQRSGTVLDQYEDNREQLGQITTIATFEPAAEHRTTLGAEELFQGLASSRLSRPGRRFRVGAFAQHAWSPIDEDERALQITPGVRLDADSQFGSQISPKLALRYQPLAYLEFRASYGRGFRAPTFQEQLLRFENPSAGYVVIGNPNLRAESSHGFDGGVRLFNELFELSAGFFRNDLRNMITYELQGRTATTTESYVYENLTRAWTMGIETAATLHVDDSSRLVLGYTWLDTWDGENHRALEGRPRHRFTANMVFMLPWQIEVVGRSALSFDRVFYVDDADGSGHQHAVRPHPLAQFDARISKHFDPYLEVFVGADNIFNAEDSFTALLPFTVFGGARGKYY